MTIAVFLLGWLLVAIACALPFGRFLSNQDKATAVMLKRRPR